MGERSLVAQAQRWMEHDPDPDTRRTLEAWIEQGDEQALREAFGPPLRFGTAGIRAPMGAGRSRMNRANVRRFTTALCAYLQSLDATNAAQGLCVGYDGRALSDAFAHEVVASAAGAGFVVRCFDRPVPTPLLAHATRRRGAAAGVMVTASHNPPGDNGVKLYWRGGGQVVAPHDRAIARAMESTDPGAVLEDARAETLGEPDIDAYFETLWKALPAAPSHVSTPRVTYSALGGVGAATTRTALRKLGVSDVYEVDAECRVDPQLAGLASPNPEHPRALTQGLAECERSESDLLLVHDPDADRLAVGVREEGKVTVLNGNELGCLLGDYCLEQPWDHTPAVVTTLVSSSLLERVASSHGALSACVPTGFKWIAAEGRRLEREEGARFVFGYEEAIGYGLPAVGEDKDGIAALTLVVRLWQTAHGQGQTLIERLHALYADHGVHRCTQITWRWPEPERRCEVLEDLRTNPPADLAGRARTDTPQDLRAPELLQWTFEDELRVALRPSGTEPTLKAYLEVRRPVTTPAKVRRAITEADIQLNEAARALQARIG